MKRILPVLCVLILCSVTAYASHIKGGWVKYDYLGSDSVGTSKYEITVYVYRDCNFIGFGPLPNAVGIYDAVTNANVKTITTPASAYIQIDSAYIRLKPPCLNDLQTNIIKGCYQIFIFKTTVTLKDNANGYLIAAQDASRVANIRNIIQSPPNGVSFTATIPPTINSVDYRANSNPNFLFRDTVLICYNTPFEYEFKAVDADNDSLTYSFGDAYNGSQSLTSPPYAVMGYKTGFTGATPLGETVSIDSLTGVISGIAPSVDGEYVIAVYVHEWRNGIRFNSTRKELQITVGNCSISPVSLKKLYVKCDDFTIKLQNETASANITSYNWDFGVTNSSTDISTDPTPAFTYADTGSYSVKLVVTNNLGCKDSATGMVKMYPGFKPSLQVNGQCYLSPVQFNDNSFVKYGTVNKWFWNFGDLTVTNDTANIANPAYNYPGPVSAIVMLSITTTVGCSGTFTSTAVINDKPAVRVAFADTLICSIDVLPLKATISSGTYQWTPAVNITNANTLTPLVSPKDTTVYTITVTDKGCVDSAKVTVNVLDFISVKFSADTGICRTDTLTLRPVSDALSYRWRESGTSQTLNRYDVKFPVGRPLATTTYFVTANLGLCQDQSSYTVFVSPYPKAKLGKDTVICFGHRTQLNADFEGTYFSWTPASSLSSITTVSPYAGPVKTTTYIFTASDTMYCPKPVSDTITISVIPPFTVFAGRDTATGINQPLQLLASGADPSYRYQWLPADYLDDPNVANPVTTITTTGTSSMRYRVFAISPEGCTASDDIDIAVFSKGPEIFIPTAFTPNGDGKNDVLKSIPVGIAKFQTFSIYNRWGQLLFRSSDPNKGWDGTYNGSRQEAGSYVCTVEGEDYTGNRIFRKTTVVLIR